MDEKAEWLLKTKTMQGGIRYVKSLQGKMENVHQNTTDVLCAPLLWQLSYLKSVTYTSFSVKPVRDVQVGAIMLFPV